MAPTCFVRVGSVMYLLQVVCKLFKNISSIRCRHFTCAIARVDFDCDFVGTRRNPLVGGTIDCWVCSVFFVCGCGFCGAWVVSELVFCLYLVFEVLGLLSSVGFTFKDFSYVDALRVGCLRLLVEACMASVILRIYVYCGSLLNVFFYFGFWRTGYFMRGVAVRCHYVICLDCSHGFIYVQRVFLVICGFGRIDLLRVGFPGWGLGCLVGTGFPQVWLGGLFLITLLRGVKIVVLMLQDCVTVLRFVHMMLRVLVTVGFCFTIGLDYGWAGYPVKLCFCVDVVLLIVYARGLVVPLGMCCSLCCRLGVNVFHICLRLELGFYGWYFDTRATRFDVGFAFDFGWISLLVLTRCVRCFSVYLCLRVLSCDFKLSLLEFGWRGGICGLVWCGGELPGVGLAVTCCGQFVRQYCGCVALFGYVFVAPLVSFGDFWVNFGDFWRTDFKPTWQLLWVYGLRLVAACGSLHDYLMGLCCGFRSVDRWFTVPW
eukprot:gene2685-1683_t